MEPKRNQIPQLITESDFQDQQNSSQSDTIQHLNSRINLLNHHVSRMADSITRITSPENKCIPNNATTTQKIQEIQSFISQIKQKQSKTQQQLNQVNESLLKLIDVMVNKWGQPQKIQMTQVTGQKQKNVSNNSNKQRTQQKEKQFQQKNNMNKQSNNKNSKENWISQQQLNNYSTQYESRLKNIVVKMPQKNCSKDQLLVWVGQMCKKVLSVGFKLFKEEEIDANKVKVFCSENILRNLINLPPELKSKGSPQQKTNWQTIDECLKKWLFPYYRFNYPQTEEKGVSRLSTLLIERDILNENENDLLLNFKDEIKFKYQEDGNYNSEIMKFLNFLIKIPNLSPKLQQQNQKSIPNNPYSLIRLFKKDMNKIFQFVQKQKNVIEIQKYNPKQKLISLYQCQKFIKNLIEEKNQQCNKYNKEQNQNSEYPFLQKEQIEYKQKVKSFTSKQIGQKLPENLQLFSYNEIQSGNLRLKNSAMMRVVTKWIEQLQKNFDSDEILNRQNLWKMKDGSEKYLKKNQMIALNTLLQRQYKHIKEQLKEIKQNNIQNQIQFSNQKVSKQLKKFSQEEAIVGQFCCSLFKINESYLINYMNKLIHGINVALSDFQKMQRVGKQWSQVFNHFNDQDNKVINQRILDQSLKIVYNLINNLNDKTQAASQTPQLITFKIGDLLRCKCTSKEFEITALYKLVEYINQTNPKFMKILRVKNKLHQGNKGILINILYRESIVVQMQLAIKSDKSKFIECSNKFNHYFYELQRGQFGPIMEMSSIWISQDQRSKFYLQKITKNNKRKQGRQILQPNDCCGSNNNNNSMNLPFRCKNCHYFYYECNFYQKHSKCSNCNKVVCCLCQLNSKTEITEKQSMFPALEQDKELIQQNLKVCKQLPMKGGKLFNINSRQKKIKTFKPIIYKNQCFIFCKDNKNQDGKQLLQLIQKFKLKQQQGKSQSQQISQQIKEWYDSFSMQNLVLYSQQAQVKYQKFDKYQAEKGYFIPKYFQKIMKSEKKSAALIKKKLKSSVFELDQKALISVQKINFSQNELSQMKPIVEKFPNIQLAVLSCNKFTSLCHSDILLKWSENITRLHLQENNIQNIQGVVFLKKLIYLNLAKNQINSIPKDLFIQLKQLEQLNLGYNQIKIQQVNVQQLSQMNKVLKSFDIRKNQLTKLPVQIGNLHSTTSLNISGNLHNLTLLDISYNQLTELPVYIGNLRSLTSVDISWNKLTELPIQIGNLCRLTSLVIFNNQLTELPSKIGNLHSLTSLVIFNNRLTELPTQISNLHSLTLLDISWNKLTELPSSIGNLHNMTSLNISFNQLTKLPAQIGNLLSLTNLNISDNKLTTLPHQSLSKLNQLKSLRIQNNPLKQILKFLRQLVSLKTLSMNIYDYHQFLPTLVNCVLLKQLTLYTQLPQESLLYNLIRKQCKMKQINLNFYCKRDQLQFCYQYQQYLIAKLFVRNP